MKNLSLSILAAFLIILSGCYKETELTPAPQFAAKNRPGTMKAKVNGNNWTAVGPVASRLSGIINVTGIAADQSLILFTLFDKGEGTYQFKNAMDGNGVYQVNQNESYNAGDTVGTVIISSIDETNETISGSFQFVGINFNDSTTKNITDGVFKNLSYATTIPPISGNNLQADVDGVTFTASSVTGGILLDELFINGTDNQGSQTIALQLPPDIAVGTYSLDGIASDYYAQYNPSSTEFLSAHEGEVNITLHDTIAKKIEGTFYFDASDFVAADTISITNGTFSTTY